MSNERGDAIQQRLDSLGISDREFQEQTGIDRKTLRRAVAGQERVRVSTLAAIEAALDKIERSVRPAVRSLPAAEEEGYVEFTVEGNFGVRAIVKGPIKDMDELQSAVARLLREMRSDATERPKSSDS